MMVVRMVCDGGGDDDGTADSADVDDINNHHRNQAHSGSID